MTVYLATDITFTEHDKSQLFAMLNFFYYSRILVNVSETLADEALIKSYSSCHVTADV